MRAAIIGLYNSGSSVLSEIVEKLGFEIGRPLWPQSFESRSLRVRLVQWWNEPTLGENIPMQDRWVNWWNEPTLGEKIPLAERLAFLGWWIERHEARNPLVCAKHPLLCLSGFDLLEAWGDDIKLIRASRPLVDSIAGLSRRGWFFKPEVMQRTLYANAEIFFDGRDHIGIEYDDLVFEPQVQIDRLIKYLGITPTESQRINAIGAVRRKSEE